MRELRRFLIGLASAATWPVYVTLVAFAAKAAPWPRDVAWPACVLLLGLAVALFFANAGRMAFGKGGWAEEVLLAPKEVTRQLKRVVLTLAIAGFVLLMPELMLREGLIAPGGRPISASALGRMLVLGFELTCWILAYRLLRSRSPLAGLAGGRTDEAGLGGPPSTGRHLDDPDGGSALVLVLDGAGFRFTIRRLTLGGLLTRPGWPPSCWGTYLLLLHDHRQASLAVEQAEPTDQPPTNGSDRRPRPMPTMPIEAPDAGQGRRGLLRARSAWRRSGTSTWLCFITSANVNSGRLPTSRWTSATCSRWA